MRCRLIMIGCCMLIPFYLLAGEGEYSVSRIPAPLLKNASVVKRMEELRFEITEGNRARITRKVAYTILNEQGERWAYFVEGYDRLRSIEHFEGALFDASGIKLKSLKKSDIKDESGTGDISLADDSRMKWHNFFYKVFPYTVEYEVEVRFKGTMFLPDWIPQEKPEMGVQASLLKIISPLSNPVHYKMFNYKDAPSITENKSEKIYQWQVRDISPVEEEYGWPAWHKLTTSVFLATESFVLDDYQGSNASWKDFGKFVYDLKKNRDELPDEIRQKVREMTAGLTNTSEKVRKLYTFMQQNTRYISIQLGIGGWQPFDAKYVGSKKYGDCKALTNFMYALLKEAGIRSVYTVINTNNPDYLIMDLPSSQFNHVVLFVPDGKDTTWLECTSQSLAPGYVGWVSNRYALAVDENGGTLVRTPKYGLNENLQKRVTVATIDEYGYLAALVKTDYSGERQDELHHLINGLTKDKLMKFLKENIELATYEVKNFDYKEEKKAVPVIVETLDLLVDNYASVSGKRFFVVPNILSRSEIKLRPQENRQFELELDTDSRDQDSTEIMIPASYTPELIPQDVKIESKFGKYSCSVKLNGDKISYYRLFEQYSGKFPASDYADLVKFYDAVYKADRNKVVLVKKQ